MLTLDDHERDGWRVVSVSGDLDVVNAPQVRNAIVQWVSNGATDLVLDLSRVDFVDSFGLGVLVGALKRVRAADGHLVVVVTERRVLSLLELTGLDSVFHIVDSVDAAVVR
jgi:anti-sigma B factor antagonist